MKLPYLSFNEWKKTRITLHLLLQIIGKLRRANTPRQNHWWHITHYVSTKGFSTHSIPLIDGINTFEIILNVHKKAVQLQNSKGEEKEILLKDGYTVSEFFKDIMKIMKEWGAQTNFINEPLDMNIDKTFEEITEYHHYDWDSIYKFWVMMLWSDGVLKEFSGKFNGKTSPVHLFWHHLDLAVSRFSSKTEPIMDAKARIIEKDAYSPEEISFGFWAGDDNIPYPAYYSYTAPSPIGLGREPLLPQSAFWMDTNGSPMAILKYQAIIQPEGRYIASLYMSPQMQNIAPKTAFSGN